MPQQLLHILHHAPADISVRFIRGRTAFGSCRQTTRAEKQLQNCSPVGVKAKEVSGEMKVCKSLYLCLLSEVAVVPFTQQACLALTVFISYLPSPPSEPGCLHHDCLYLILGLTGDGCS